MKKILVAIAAMAFTTTAWASATVSRLDGGVLVNQGEHYQNAQAGQVVNPGDRFMVPAGGQATLVFDDGCTVDLPPDSLATVPEKSPCAGGDLMSQRVSPQPQQPTQVGTRANAATQVGTRPHAGENWLAWTFGGIVAIILISNSLEDDDDTASP